jgi:DNA-binding transcriptional LysR family regulator
LAFVAGGIGVTILPDLAVPEEMPGVESRPLVNPTPRRRIVAHVRDGAATAPPVAHAVGLLQEAAAQTAARRSAT